MAESDTIQRLREMAPSLCERFRLNSLAVFGSVARGEQRPDSDLDVLATFEGGPDLRRFMGLKFFLEDTLGIRVDLSTPSDIKDHARPSIEKDVVRVA